MHTVINIHEAKTHFSKLLEKVQEGETVIIARAGVPIAKLIAWEQDANTIQAPGALESKGFWIAEDFDASIADLFEQE